MTITMLSYYTDILKQRREETESKNVLIVYQKLLVF